MIFSNAFFIILRRMRVPIVILIVVYTISMLGLTLIPGIDSNGKETSPMSFFHAFYFVSYTATSLGLEKSQIRSLMLNGCGFWCVCI